MQKIQYEKEYEKIVIFLAKIFPRNGKLLLRQMQENLERVYF
jgi:hypothetical protein